MLRFWRRDIPSMGNNGDGKALRHNQSYYDDLRDNAIKHTKKLHHKNFNIGKKLAKIATNQPIGLMLGAFGIGAGLFLLTTLEDDIERGINTLSIKLSGNDKPEPQHNDNEITNDSIFKTDSTTNTTDTIQQSSKLPSSTEYNDTDFISTTLLKRTDFEEVEYKLDSTEKPKTENKHIHIAKEGESLWSIVENELTHILGHKPNEKQIKDGMDLVKDAKGTKPPIKWERGQKHALVKIGQPIDLSDLHKQFNNHINMAA